MDVISIDDLIVGVLRLYDAPESQRSRIVRFLKSNPGLANTLLEAVPHLESVFGDAYRYLELERDPYGWGEEIFCVVLVKGEPEQALELLHQFDEMWFSQKSTNSDKLNFTVDTVE